MCGFHSCLCAMCYCFDEKLILVFHLLGYLYLMQLRYKDGQFATRPNSAWRLVFVMALMPWLHKYRQLARLDDFGRGRGRRRIRSQ